MEIFECLGPAAICSITLIITLVIPYIIKKLKSKNVPVFHIKEKDNDQLLSEDEDDDWEGKDRMSWKPHKMVLVVRNDLKMGKGKIAAQCSHATLGAYKKAKKLTPVAVKIWESLGQAKVCVKVDSENELLNIAAAASTAGLIYFIVIDAGRTQIAPDSKTVVAIGPAPIEEFQDVTGNLKLL